MGLMNISEKSAALYGRVLMAACCLDYVKKAG